MIPNVGHLPYEESPVVFSEIVNSFLDTLDRGDMRKGPHLVRPGITG